MTAHCLIGKSPCQAVPTPKRLFVVRDDTDGLRIKSDLTVVISTDNPTLSDYMARACNTYDALVAALEAIASFDDEGANERLEQTGSYVLFDEPGSVKIARAALALAKGDAR
jgi:hypothetical protein